MILLALFIFNQFLWIETTQEDFLDGTYERNIYASHLGGGTMEFVPRSDLNNDGFIDLYTADGGASYVRIYWGNATGYSPNDTTLFPTTSASNCDAADLNGDGYTDFLVVHQLDPKISIYWGTPTGPDPSFYFDIPTVQTVRQAIYVADFDKDGYLDIATSQQIIAGYGAIFWGSATGYDINNRTDLPVAFGVHNIEVGDFDWNGWLDILYVEYQNPDNKIYWGSSSGFNPSNCTLLPGPGSFGSSVADLNRDRYIDLIFTAWYARQSYIYWGSPSGYSISNRQILNPGYCYGGSTVADMNSDGYLDIVYHRGGFGSHEQEIYWGSASGYSDADTSWFGLALTTNGGFVADLNYDGNLDVFCDALGSRSYIFWGPSFNTNTTLLVNDDHQARFREIGNVYNRAYDEFYISSIFNARDTVNWGTAEWDDSLPLGTSVDFRIRTGNTPIHDPTWSSWCILSSGDSIPDSLNSQYIQYMANLKYTNPAFLPFLYEVRISYDSLTGIQTQNDNLTKTPITVLPNPFSSKTTISYVVNKPNNEVSIKVFDITGRCVRTLVKQPQEIGTCSIDWFGDDNMNKKLPTGVYYLKLRIDDNEVDVKTVRIAH